MLDRRKFLEKFIAAGTCACGCVMAIGSSLQAQIAGSDTMSDQKPKDWIEAAQDRMLEASRTPEAARFKKASVWIRDLIDNMDRHMDSESRLKLLNACGRSCYVGAFGVASAEPPSLQAAERWMTYLKNAGYNIREESGLTVVDYSWGRDHQNPWGLMLKDGYCLCPIVESIPKGLSASFCNCSAGYIKEMFERFLGKTVHVEVIETLQTGADDCRFRVTIDNNS